MFPILSLMGFVKSTLTVQNMQPVHERCHVNWVSHGQQLEKFCFAFYTGTPTRFRLCSNWNTMICSNIWILPFGFWHEWKWMTCGQKIFCGLTRCTLYWKVQWIRRTVKYRVQLPRVVHQRSRHSEYVTVWCEFTSTFIFGPSSLKELHQRDLSGVPWRLQVTKTSLCFLWFLRCKNVIILGPLLLCRVGYHCISFAKFNVTLLRGTFTDERIISRCFPNPWPARSPDLNPCEFWLWGYLKDRVYQGPVRSLVDLRTSIQRHVTQIPREPLRATVDDAILRMQHGFSGVYGRNYWLHIENIL